MEIGRPICALCGDEISADFGDLPPELSYKRMFDERREWKTSLQNHGYVSGSPADLRNVYFFRPWHWKRLFRAIVRDENNELHLTGVGLGGPWILGTWRLPVNSNDMFMGDPWAAKDPPRFMETCPDDVRSHHAHENHEPFAYMIHERCWVLMTRLVDGSLIEVNLGSFLQAVYETGWWRMKHVRFQISGKYDDESEWIFWRKSAGQMPRQEPARYIESYSGEWRCNELRHALRDPWKVNDIRTHIEVEKRLYHQELILERYISSSETSAPPTTQNVFLPPEIIMVILDYLSTSRDIRVLMWAFPHSAVQVPWTYWRKRFIKELMLEDEAENIPSATALNWRRHYYKRDRIIGGSHGLQNRMRILGILEGTKHSFLKKMRRRKEEETEIKKEDEEEETETERG